MGSSLALWTVLGLLSPLAPIAFASPSDHPTNVKFFPRHHVEDAEEHASPYFAHNPHRQLLKRSLTTNINDVQGLAFDFVIAGGGTAGLALASRLSEWSNTTVLCIEAGGDGSEYQERIDVPGASYLNSLGGTDFDWSYTTVEQKDADGKTRGWPRGKGLGGSGSTNGLFWGRGGEQDYDAWGTLNPDGEHTWNWSEMDKYINKAEHFNAAPAAQVEQFNMSFDASVHGQSGPIQSGFCEYIYDAVANWVPAWVNLGLPAVDLWAGSARGVMITPSIINPVNQTRSNSKAGYIDPLPPRSNLVILTGQQVTSVIFNGSTDANGGLIASGVTFQASRGATSYSVQANKEVILAGGTVGSAQLLQLSGIGPASRMTGLGIQNRVDLPVGYNLQDHVSYSMYWTAPDDVVTWGVLQADPALQASELQKWRDTATGLWTYVNEAVGYVSMNDIMDSATAQNYIQTVGNDYSELADTVAGWQTLPSNVASGLKKQYEIMHQRMSTDLGQLEIIMTMLGYNGRQHELGIQVALQHPWSRGSIIISSTDPFTDPAIDPDYFGVGYDIDIMQYGSEFARRLAGTAPLSNVMTTESLPGASITGDALNNFTKQNAGTEYHPLGTCSMLPRDQGGVVDTSLLVYGTSNLRVIDASIMPLQISAHLMASTYGIAEKGADIIKQKYWKVEATNTTAGSGSGNGNGNDESGTETTASPGQATDTKVTDQNNLAAAGSSPMSMGTKIGVGVGVGVGAAALLAALVAFCLFRRKKRQAPGNSSGWYDPTPTNDPSGGYREAGAAGAGAYPLAPFAAPAHTRSDSMDTMATAELAGRAPFRSQSGYGGFGEGAPYTDSGRATPVEMGGAGPGGYGLAGAEGSYPTQQSYRPVNLS